MTVLSILLFCCAISTFTNYVQGVPMNKTTLSAILESGRPRFKQNQRVIHEVFLNDKAVFKCNALARPAPKIFWYRNGEFLNYTMLNHERFRENKKHFSFEIKRVEVGDQGAWSCKVWNNAGSIYRNFTLEIIDFCDYFFMNEFPPSEVPEKCICSWYLIGEHPKEGINWSEVNDERCKPYKKYAMKMRKPFGKKICESGVCAGNALSGSTSAVSSSFGDFGLPNSQSDVIVHDRAGMQDATSPDDNGQGKISGENVGRPFRVGPDTLMNDAPEIDVQHSGEAALPSLHHLPTQSPTTSALRTTTSSTRSSTRISYSAKVKPYFKNREVQTTKVVPSGKTVKLQCKAGGVPDPQVIWYNNKHKVITTEVRRSVGSEYRLRKNTLEIEDATPLDNGDYMCEVFNSVGSINRTYRLFVVERMRSKPIIIPNILVNKTVDANSTVNFTCKVISDLNPYIFWMKVELTNDSIFYWNETNRRYAFRYTDMSQIENANISVDGDSSTLTITNVTMDDQGMYACVTGNKLGYSIANATLRVNEFHGMTIATGAPDGGWSWVTLLALSLSLLLLGLFLAAAVLYVFCVRRNSKAQIAQMEQLIGPVKKRVVITKRTIDSGEADGWSDMPSTYQIHIEPIATSGHRRPRLSSDLTLLSDYEIPPDPAWEVERSRLRFIDMLGEGAFGEVWKAMLKTDRKISDSSEVEQEETLVAVKKLKASAHEKELIDLVSEMETFKIIGQHENLLRLIGCCTGTGPLYVILELCKYGNLRDFLRAHRPRDQESGCQVQDSPTANSEPYLEPRKFYGKATAKEQPVLIKHLTQRHLVQFAWQIAKGMDFMASRKVIHRDLAARNVLVTDEYVMKISDFGLSRDVHYNDYYRKKGNGRLPIKWMALEALDSHVYTIYSDVWSFGILLWEIMTLGGTPYPSIAMQQLYSCLKEGYRMEAPDNCPEELYDVMVSCWQEKPENRPTFDTLVDYFDWMLTQSAQDQENYLEVQSTSSAADAAEDEIKDVAPPPPLDESGKFVKRRRVRPLSEPIISPVEPIEDSESESDVENDSRPLLLGTKAILYNQQVGPGIQYAFVRRPNGIPMPDSTTSSLCSEKKLHSAATMSVDSAIGSPLWPIEANMSTSLDARDSFPSESEGELVRRRPLNYEDCIHPTPIIGEGGKESLTIDHGKRQFDDDPFLSLSGQYVNVQGGDPQRGKLFSSRFPFPPSRHTRFSDSSAYESDAVQLSVLNGSAADNLAANFSSARSDVEKSINGSTIVEISSQNGTHQRRYSIGSSSSGRGGSSGMSSAEGLGGIADFCQIEYLGETKPAHKTLSSPIPGAGDACSPQKMDTHNEQSDCS